MHMNDYVGLDTNAWTSRKQSVPLFKFEDDNLQRFEEFTPALTVWFDCKQHFFWRIVEGLKPKCLETEQDLLDAFGEIKSILEKHKEGAIENLQCILNDPDKIHHYCVYHDPTKELTIFTEKIWELSHAQEKALMLLKTTQITHLPEPKLEI